MHYASVVHMNIQPNGLLYVRTLRQLHNYGLLLIGIYVSFGKNGIGGIHSSLYGIGVKCVQQGYVSMHLCICVNLDLNEANKW